MDDNQKEIDVSKIGPAVMAWWKSSTTHVKTTIIVAFLMFLGLIALCAVIANSGSDNTPVSSSSESSSYVNSADISFLADVHQRSGISTYSDSGLISGAHWVCSQRAAGNSEQAVMYAEYHQTILSAFDSGFMVAASERAYCPQYYS